MDKKQNIIYMLLNIAMLAIIIWRASISANTPQGLGLSGFYADIEPPGINILDQRRVDTSRSVTGQDIEDADIKEREDVEQFDNISVEMTVVSARLIQEYTDNRGNTTREAYSLVGQDEDGFHWYVTSIDRRNINEPNPVEDYPPGTKLVVYGFLSYVYSDYTEYVMELDDRIPRLVQFHIEVVD